MNKIALSRKLKDGEYYKYSKDKGFIAIDPNEIIYNGHTIDNLEKYYKSHIELKKKLENITSYLRDLLKQYNISIDKDDFDFTIEKTYQLLSELTTMITTNTFKINENGFVEHFDSGKYIISKTVKNVPKDVNNGYYRVFIDTKGKVVFRLDETKYEEEMM